MQGFRTGQTAMVLHHTGSLAEISADLTQGEQFMTTMVPAGPAMQVAVSPPQYNGISKEDNADLAWAWLTHWTEARRRDRVPGDDRLLPGIAVRQFRCADHRQPDLRRGHELDPGRRPPAEFVGAPGWQSPRFSRISSILTGQSTPEEAVDQMIADLEAEIG